MGFLKGTEELRHWDFNATGIILVKLLAKFYCFLAVFKLPSIFFFFFVRLGDYQDVRIPSITTNPTVVCRLILKGFKHVSWALW